MTVQWFGFDPARATYQRDHFCYPSSVKHELKATKKKDSEISGFILNHVICGHSETERDAETVWICEDICQEASSALQSEVMGKMQDRIRMARGEKKKNAHKSMLSVRLLTDDWIHAEHHMWDTHAAPAPLLHVPPRGPSTGTTLPLSGCVTSCSQLMTTKVDQHCVVHSLPSYLHPSWGEDTFKHFACLNVIKKDRLHVYL